MMRKIICLTILAVFITIGNATAGGGWPQPKGAIYVKLSQWWIVYNQYYDENGLVLSDRTRSIGHTSFYVEYGLTERFTAIAYMPFFSKATLFEQLNTQSGNIVQEGDKVTSVGDAQLALKYNLLNDKQAPVNISVSTILGIPLGENDGGYDGSLQTGDGEFNQMLRLDVSGSVKIGDFYPYYSIFGALNNRTEGFSDDYRLGVEAGFNLSFITALCKVRSVKSFENGSLNDQLVGTNIGGNNTEFVMVEPEMILNFSDHVGLSFTYSKPVSGRLIFSEPSYTIGISYKSNK